MTILAAASELGPRRAAAPDRSRCAAARPNLVSPGTAAFATSVTVPVVNQLLFMVRPTTMATFAGNRRDAVRLLELEAG
ncbi:hypothetical protein [Sorangium sp. So ce887]|uniref:hypothetical protein n=1 Tax=Sorangium sp. So ce887 TaxID=3133324 RepID=UPI003F5DDEF5